MDQLINILYVACIIFSIFCMYWAAYRIVVLCLGQPKKGEKASARAKAVILVTAFGAAISNWIAGCIIAVAICGYVLLHVNSQDDGEVVRRAARVIMLPPIAMNVAIFLGILKDVSSGIAKLSIPWTVLIVAAPLLMYAFSEPLVKFAIAQNKKRTNSSFAEWLKNNL